MEKYTEKMHRGDVMKKANHLREGQVLSTYEAAEYLGIISPRTLEKWRGTKGKGPSWINIEGKIGYRVKDLDEYVEKCTQKNPEDDFAA